MLADEGWLTDLRTAAVCDFTGLGIEDLLIAENVCGRLQEHRP